MRTRHLLCCALLTGTAAADALAAAELVQQSGTAILISGGETRVHTFAGRYSRNDGSGADRVLARARTSAPAYLEAQALVSQLKPGSASVDLSVDHTFRFSADQVGQLATLTYSFFYGLSLSHERGDVRASAGLNLYAPDGEKLLEQIWYRDLDDPGLVNSRQTTSPVKFVIEPGLYRMDAAAYAYAFAPAAAGSSMTFVTLSPTLTVSPVPEPATWALWAAGLVAAGLARRRFTP